MRKIRLAVLAVSVVATACTGQPVTVSPIAVGASPTGAARTSSSELADVVYMNANVITMDDDLPAAEAVAIRGETIIGVGSNDDLRQFEGSGTRVVDVGGRTIVPGFIDAHQHRIGDGPRVLGLDSPTPIIDAAIDQGWTTINELYVDDGRLDQLRDLDLAGALRLDVNAYLPVNENSAEGRLLGPYFDAYQPGQMVSPHVRIAGLKVFTDFDNARILLWKQPDLDAFLLEQHRKGWQLAIKTVSTKSLAMIVKAFRSIAAVDPKVVNSRGLLEHMLFATSDQLKAIKELGLIPIINLNNPGQLDGEPDVAELIKTEPGGSYTPWRSVFYDGLPAAGMTGFPSFHVDEPSGAPFGSPIHLLFQAVTRVGNLGHTPPPSLLDQAITVREALQALTINAARSSFEEGVKGSVTSGKRADLALLSADPLAVSADGINEISVLMTLIRGKVEHCAAGAEPLCSGAGAAETTPTPSASSEAGAGGSANVTASNSLADSPPSNAADGNPETIWNSGAYVPQWIQMDLGRGRTIGGVRLLTAQTPAGPTVYQIWVGDSVAGLRLAHEFDGTTKDDQQLVWAPPKPATNVRFIRIVTTKSPSWVGWREIELIDG